MECIQDALACLFKLDNRDTIFNKSIQIPTYADDVDIITRSVRKAFTMFEDTSENMVLNINERKKMIMVVKNIRRVQSASVMKSLQTTIPL